MWIWDLHEDLRAGRSLALVCSAALKIGRAKEGCRSPTAKAFTDWVSVTLSLCLSVLSCRSASSLCLSSPMRCTCTRGGVGLDPNVGESVKIGYERECRLLAVLAARSPS